MLRCLVRSRIQRLVVTGKNAKLPGSRECDSRLLGVDAVRPIPYRIQ
jgi:hypothetical protein